jgi:hypothetical protein
MAREEYIREFGGAILGRIKTDDNGDKTAYDFYGRILGYYKKKYDHTTDFYGRIIARGDAAVSLIYQAKNK